MTTKLEEAQRPSSCLNPELVCHTLPILLPGHLPTDWRVATRLPAATPPPLATAAAYIILAATPPPLATAAADIILAAMEEAAIPAPVKPMAPSTTGTDPTARAVGRGEIWG